MFDIDVIAAEMSSRPSARNVRRSGSAFLSELRKLTINHTISRYKILTTNKILILTSSSVIDRMKIYSIFAAKPSAQT